MRQVLPPHLGARVTTIVAAAVFPLTPLQAQRPVEEPSWSRQFGTPRFAKANAIAVRNFDVYVAGTTNGEFAGPRGQQDGFLVKFEFDSEGTVVWSRQFGTNDQNEDVSAVAVGPSGLYGSGRTTGALQGEKPRGLWDGFVMQFDLDGRLQWTRQIAGPGDGDNVQGPAVGLTHLLVTGAVDGALPSQKFAGGVDAFCRLYDFTGTEAGTREFGNGLTAIGDNDAFVMKMAPKPLDILNGPTSGVGPSYRPVQGRQHGAGRNSSSPARRAAPETPRSR